MREGGRSSTVVEKPEEKEEASRPEPNAYEKGGGKGKGESATARRDRTLQLTFSSGARRRTSVGSRRSLGYLAVYFSGSSDVLYLSNPLRHGRGRAKKGQRGTRQDRRWVSSRKILNSRACSSECDSLFRLCCPS